MGTAFRSFVVATSLLTLAVVPTWAQDVNADFDKTANFAGYTTYAWTQGTVPQGANPLMIQRVQSAIESEMSAIGLIRRTRSPTCWWPCTWPPGKTSACSRGDMPRDSAAVR